MQKLPLYQLGDTHVEAFMITHMEAPGNGVVLWGPNGIRLAVRNSYLEDHYPRVGGYYVCFPDGVETFVDSDDFIANFQPAE